MGTEGATLLRFGDHGNLPDRIQPNGQGTELPVSLKTDKWYHVAFVVDGNKCYGYINGEKVGEFNKGGRLGEFFIGRSYNENRGIVARFSEIRLWSVARSGAQIKENMYKVSGSTTGLYAYWKMNEVKNNQIPDASNNDRPLILKKQKDKSRLEISIYDEKNEVNIEN